MIDRIVMSGAPFVLLFAVASAVCLVAVYVARVQLRAADEKLRQSEERFGLTIDEAPIGMALVALDGRFVRVNRALAEIVGYTPAELTNLTFQAITHRDDVDVDVKLAARLARGEIPRYRLGKRYLRKDGTSVDVELSVSLVRGRFGAPLYYIAQVEDVTERKRAEAALRRSESQFRELIERMPDGVIVIQDGGVRYANQAFAALLGYDAAWGIVGARIEDLLHHRDLANVAEGVGFLARGLAVPPREHRMVRRDGSLCDLETTAIEIRFEGQPAVVVIARDLTERKRADEARRLWEARFSAIIAISADAIISIDERQRITMFNDGAEKIFGYSKADAIGAPLEMLVPAAASVVARGVGEGLRTLAGRRKSGEEFPAEAAISRLEVGDQKLLTLALRDVTERTRREREQRFLAEAAAVLASTLDYEETLAAVARLVVRDFADWCFVEIVDEHDQLRRLKVVSADPTRTAICQQLEKVPIDGDEPHLLRPVAETKRPLLVEHVSAQQLESVAQGPQHLAALRAVNPLSLMALPLLRHGELLGTLAFISSSPSRVYRAVDLPLAETLAERAAAAIENARLYRASVYATQLRDQVLGIVAHDLRNPLSAILMQAASMRRPPPQPERRTQRPREIIHRAATRMNRLIDDLLDVARMEAGQLRVERARVDCETLLAEAADSQRPLAASSSVDLRLDLSAHLPAVWGDRDRLLQVFENLIGNAAKFTPSGGRIIVGAQSRADDVVFWVADSGGGIDAESLRRVFDRFWQATRPGRHGAGLGLPITKGIVEAHGGRMWVESALGRGSTFFFAIPRAESAAASAAEALH